MTPKYSQIKRLNDFEVRAAANRLDADRLAKRRERFDKKFGLFGEYILKLGKGGGFYATPEALDTYEACLGVTPGEMWLLKRLIRFLPNVFPSMSRIAKEAGHTSESTLSRTKKRLVQRGLVRDLGRKDDRLQHELSLEPLWNAVFLCGICDPHSKLVAGQNIERIRADFTARLQCRQEADQKDVEWYESKIRFSDFEFPLSIQDAQTIAKAWGFTLAWDAVAKLQSGPRMEELAETGEAKQRELEMKAAIRRGAQGSFQINYRFQKTYEWFRWFCSLPLTPDQVERLTRGYVNEAEMPRPKDFMQWVSERWEWPEVRRSLVEQKLAVALA